MDLGPSSEAFRIAAFVTAHSEQARSPENVVLASITDLPFAFLLMLNEV